MPLDASRSSCLPWQYIPQVEFSAIDKLSPEKIARIKQAGSVVIRNVVDDDEAAGYKESLKEYVKANPQVHGFPEVSEIGSPLHDEESHSTVDRETSNFSKCMSFDRR